MCNYCSNQITQALYSTFSVDINTNRNYKDLPIFKQSSIYITNIDQT